MPISDRKKQIGAFLKDSRIRAGLSQSDVAEAMSTEEHPLRQTQIAKMEAGTRPVSLLEALAFCRAVDVAPAHMVEAIETPTPKQSIESALRDLGILEAQTSLANNVRNELRKTLKACATIEHDASQSEPPDIRESDLYSSYVVLLSRFNWIAEKIAHDETALLLDLIYCIGSIQSEVSAKDIVKELQEAGRDYSEDSELLKAALRYRDERIAEKLTTPHVPQLAPESHIDEN
ncbi:helix-turn-helix domain-containing protein [Corynebacterium variabile]|uniref:helix-turn-helix domain-containing protein n=1 Tax=Corynebacterium variabile TaxID=1727 RepID=UPI003FD0D3D8